MKRIFALIGVLLLAVAGVSYLYFSSLRGTNAGYTQIVEAIPADAVLAYSFTNEKEYDDIFKSNTLFASVTGKKTLEDFRQIKDFINQKNTLKQAFNGQMVFFSLHADTLSKQLNWLMITAIPKDLSWNELEKTISRYGIIKEIRANGQTINSLTARGMEKPVYFVRHKGLVALAFSPAMLARFVNNSGETPFTQLADQQNRTALAGLMVNYRMMPKLAAILNRNRTDRLFSMLPAMDGSAATTITYNKSALLFNGFTRIRQSGNFAGLLYGQTPVKLNIDRVLPDEMAAYIAVGLSNYRLFMNKLDSLYQTNGFGTKKKALQKQLSFNLSSLMQQQFAGEYALALMPNTEKMAFVKIKNGLKLKQFLMSMSESENDESIGRFRYDNFPEAYFGPVFHDLRRPYFAVVDEYLVMANNYSTLNRYTQTRQSSSLLGTDQDYARQKALMADRGNMSWFVFLKNAKSILRQQLKPDVYDFISVDDEPKLNDFDGFSLQLSVNGGEFYTNICLRQGEVESYDEKPVWEYKLGARLYGEPKIIIGADGKKLILLEDASNRLHAVNDSGKIIWQKQLNGHILGDVQTSNNTLLFNTTRKIYQLNKQGEDIAGFPIDLAATATAGITVFNKTIIVPMGNRLAGYLMDGTAQPSWENSVSGRIRFPLKEAGFAQTKWLAALTEQGYVYLYSTDGKQQEKLDMNAGSAFPFPYALRTGSNRQNTCLISATREGEIYRMYFDGHTEHENVGVFTGEITFDCLNILGDEKPEMIFLDARQLTIYTGNHTQAYNYLFTKPVKASVQVIDDRPVKRVGVRAKRGNELYLFNDDGSLTSGFPFKGNSLFWAGDLYGNGQKFIILGEGGSAKAYALQ